MKKATDYFFLEKVPKVYPMDILFIDLAHMLAANRSEFNVEDPGTMLLTFSEGSGRLFMEREKWPIFGRKVLDTVLKTDESVSNWEKKAEQWASYIANLADVYKSTDYSMFQDASLCLALDSLNNTEKMNGIQSAEFLSPNYGTNFIHQAFEQALRDLGFEPHAIMPILLRSTQHIEALEYEKQLGDLALDSVKNKIDVPERMNIIHKEFEWLDAAFGGDPKSKQTMEKDFADLISFGEKLEGILVERDEIRKKKTDEKNELMVKVLEKASPEQKRIIRFACRNAEIGSILVDGVMKFVYYRRSVYKEFAKRLGLSEIDVKCLLPEELRLCLLEKVPVDSELINQRKKISVFVLSKDGFELHVGKEAEIFESELISSIAEIDKPLKGEISFSAGKVRGIARLVSDVSDMDKVKEGDILVSSRTYPDLLPAMKRSGAIISELGGLLSHAAIVSRELKIPCIVGVRNATSRIKDGDMLELDTNTGKIEILK